MFEGQPEGVDFHLLEILNEMRGRESSLDDQGLPRCQISADRDIHRDQQP